MLFPKPTKINRSKTKSEFKGNSLPYCQACGVTGTGIERHHIKKRSQGGDNSLKNRIDLCKQCHIKADSKVNGYEPKNLYWYKWKDKKRIREIRKILSP